MIRTLLCILTLVGLSSKIHAESWVDLAETKSVGFLQLDLDTISQAGENKFSATWRTGMGLKISYFIRQGVADCENDALKIERESYIGSVSSSNLPEVPSSTSDFITGKLTVGGQIFRLSDDDRFRSVVFPASGTAEARLTRYLCQSYAIYRLKHELTGEVVQKEFGCADAKVMGSPLCATDLATRDTLGALFMRLNQVQHACALSGEQVNVIANDWLSIPRECRGTGASCDLSAVRIGISGLGKDLARVVSKQNCEFVALSLKSAEENEERRVGLQRFSACVRRTISELDDKVTGPDVIAKGVFSACRGELSAQLAQSDVYASRVQSGLIAAVLEFRRKARQAIQAPTERPKSMPSDAPKIKI